MQCLMEPEDRQSVSHLIISELLIPFFIQHKPLKTLNWKHERE